MIHFGATRAALPRLTGALQLTVLLALVVVQAQTQGSAGLAAQRALLIESDVDAARVHASAALRRHPPDARALFVEMEAAALQADTAAMLEAAVRLCETSPGDPRAAIAAARLRASAANTRAFRQVLPRLQKVVAAGTPEAQTLRLALIAAALDGAPGLHLHQLARAAGVLTEWRMAGPFGRHSYADFDRAWPPEGDSLAAREYDGRFVEPFSFADGSLRPPHYFGSAGVYYAAASIRVPAAGNWRVEVESPGTLHIFVNGEPVITHDRRYRAGPRFAGHTLKLPAGSHTVLVKFVPTSAPWRLAVIPAGKPASRHQPGAGFAPEDDYLAAALLFWQGDYDATLTRLTESSHAESAVAQMLVASAWAALEPASSEESAALRAALKAAPSALAAEHRLARRAHAAGREDEALERARRVLAVRPDFMPAHALMAEVATGLKWDSAALEARQALLQRHPSCDTLRAAARFFASSARFDRAAEAERQLQGCASGSLAYAESLSQMGRHREAAQAAARLVAEDPLHRSARALLVRQLELAGDAAAARREARALHDLAPNSAEYRRLHQRLFSGDWAAAAEAEPFYAPYRRDPLQVIQRSGGHGFPSASAVILLHERVAHVDAGGRVSLYVHRLIQPQNREGVRRQREVSLPAGAEVLELRTLRADGSIAEPEFTPHKQTISMTGLTPGDVIQQEYVLRYPLRQGAETEPEALRFTFGNLNSPTLLARFVTLAPAVAGGVADAFQPLAWGGAPQPSLRVTGELLERAWKRTDIAPAGRSSLPGVRLVPATEWEELRLRARHLALSAARIGHRIERAARALPAHDELAAAQAAYRFVQQNVAPAASSFAEGDLRTAEQSLASGSGSPTAVLLALARAAGLHADLILGTEIAGKEAQEEGALGAVPTRRAYTRPLVRLHAAGRSWIVDVESRDLEFGQIAKDVNSQQALLVPLENLPAAPLLLPLDPADALHRRAGR